MSIEKWSDEIFIIRLQDDPTFTDDVTTTLEELGDNPNVHAVLDFESVGHMNSSNIAKLLKLRKQLLNSKKRLILCNIDTNVWGLFLVTGLDKVFEFANNVGEALTTLQIAGK
ncbi:MAG: STAS domain-containing protein [Phycisphaerales bacterium]|nr:MAG: STAS domain-containing protein [Phycisphaerales bacterium]